MQDFELKRQEDGSYRGEIGEVAELKQGVLSGLTRVELFGLPIGKAAGGILTVMGWDMLRGAVAGVIPAVMPDWLIPAIGSWVMTTKTVSGFVGSEVANTAGIILLVDALQASPLSPRKLLAGVLGSRHSSSTLGEQMEKETTYTDVVDFLKAQK